MSIKSANIVIDSLSVKLNDGTEVTNLYETMESTFWQHQWHEMSTWSGKTVTLTFALQETANTINTGAVIDEVTVGSTYPDLWIDGSQGSALPRETIVQRIVYGNRGGATAVTNLLTYTLPVGLSFVSASVPPTATTTDQMIWQINELPGKGEPFTIDVTVMIAETVVPFTTLTSTIEIGTDGTELEMLNNQAEGRVFIGRSFYLPLIAKN